MVEAVLSWRLNIALGLIVALLAGYIWFYERKQLGSAAYEGRGGRILVGFDKDHVESIIIRPKAGETIELVRRVKDEEVSWALKQPKESKADVDVVDAYLANWEFGIALRRLRDVSPGELPQFGLDPPEARVQLGFIDGTTVELRLGAPDPVSAGRYLVAAPATDVVVVDHSMVDAFGQPVDDFVYQEQDLDSLVIDDAGVPEEAPPSAP